MRPQRYYVSLWMTILLLLCLNFTIVATNPYEDILSDGSFEEFTDIVVFICVASLIIPLIISLLLGIWIYKDAEKRGKNGILWFIILFVFGVILNFIGIILVLIIWLTIRPPVGGIPSAEIEDIRRCMNCGRGIPLDAIVCPYCGKHFN